MRIGLTYNVRPAGDVASPLPSSVNGHLPLPLDDANEEFDSPETIAAIARTLEELGHQVELLGDGELLARRLLEGPRPDLVWNIAEGAGAGRSREARVPALLEMLGIPYTGSDPLTLAVALDKDCAKRLVDQAGVPTPRWCLFCGERDFDYQCLSFPVFVKPAYEGSSKGILTSSILHDAEQLQSALDQLYEVYRQPILVEEFIDGDELTVGVVGNTPAEVLGVMRVLPRASSPEPFVYSLEVKRDWQRQVRYECPAELSSRDTLAVREAALRCWSALGCQDVARIDFRLKDGVPYFLEANPLPGLSPGSGDLVLMSGYLGIEYRDLVGRILSAALERLGYVGSARSAPISLR